MMPGEPNTWLMVKPPHIKNRVFFFPEISKHFDSSAAAQHFGYSEISQHKKLLPGSFRSCFCISEPHITKGTVVQKNFSLCVASVLK